MLRPAALFVLLCTPLGLAQTQPKPGQPHPEGLQAGVYRNKTLGFSYNVVYGWVDRTREMNHGNDPAETSHALLAVFESPPEARTETLNPGVIIASEPSANYPSLRQAAQYFEVLNDAASAGGFKPAGDPYEESVSGKLLARQDLKNDTGKLHACQSSLVMLSKGQVVSFTFIASTEEEVQSLIDRLKFTSK
jgi:hypothetical protein